jgi:chaperonin GroEL (HSP60 family)
MDKLILKTDGDIMVTNDGYFLLKEMEVVHPVAKMVVATSELQVRQSHPENLIK